MKFKSSRFSWSKLPVLAGSVLMASALSLPAFAQSETLFFASDVHNKMADLQSLINAHNSCELYGLVGDYNSGDPYVMASTQSDLNALIALMPSGANKIAIEGNHDDQNDVHYPASPADGGDMTLSGNTFYDVYTINYDTYIGTSARLTEYLASHTGKLVFVLGHYPLHSMRDATYAAEATAIFGVLQNYGNQMDLVYIYGHNHRDADLDKSVRTMAVPGDIIRNGPTHSGLNTSVTETPIVFTYMRAGYIKPIPNQKAQATVVTLDRYGMTMERYEKGNSNAIEYGYTSRCGDGICKPGAGENACNCYSDCGNQSGQGSCYLPLSCGGQSPGGCYCDDACEYYNDCCFDKMGSCGCATP